MSQYRDVCIWFKYSKDKRIPLEDAELLTAPMLNFYPIGPPIYI